MSNSKVNYEGFKITVLQDGCKAEAMRERRFVPFENCKKGISRERYDEYVDVEIECLEWALEIDYRVDAMELNRVRRMRGKWVMGNVDGCEE